MIKINVVLLKTHIFVAFRLKNGLRLFYRGVVFLETSPYQHGVCTLLKQKCRGPLLMALKKQV